MTGDMSRRATLVVAVAVALVGIAVGIGLDAVDDGDGAASGPSPAGGIIPGPAPCAEGSTVAITVDVAEGVPEVRVVRPDGSVAVAAPAVASQPSFSPDGRRVVVVAAEGDYESAGPDSTSLLALGLDGADPVAVTSVGGRDDAPAWSPDGHSVAFVRHDGARRRDEIVVAGIDGADPRPVVTLA
ncbi:MAG TPA: hypothetical protein VGO60_09595, partial [Iamia sp.]|nr:hypothetical protein [Iamia sp.]